ncbi:MAG: hypothetical protein KKF80_05245 [Candidatus Omnitrophica bacterium]|nr:hypothetical protein [Candidatus Omnitrophota bacterium]
MVKRITLFFIIAIVTFSFQGFSIAKKEPAKKITAPQRGLSTSKVIGKVVKRDIRQSTITVSAEKVTFLSILIDKNTLISKAGKNVTMRTIQVGDFVSVIYINKNDLKLATNITVTSYDVSSSVTKKR